MARSWEWKDLIEPSRAKAIAVGRRTDVLHCGGSEAEWSGCETLAKVLEDQNSMDRLRGYRLLNVPFRFLSEAAPSQLECMRCDETVFLSWVVGVDDHVEGWTRLGVDDEVGG